MRHLQLLSVCLATVAIAACDCGGTNARPPVGQGGSGVGGAGGSGGTGGAGGIYDACDMDGDGHRSITCGGDDCNDTLASVHPGATETCDNFIDDNCDGHADEDCPCTAGSTRSCYPPGLDDPTRSVGACQDGKQTCGADLKWNDCQDAVTPAPEGATCDGVDQDCNGTVDDNLLNRCGVCGQQPVEVCQNGLDDDCDGVVDNPDFCNVSCVGVDVDNPQPPSLACCVADPDGTGPLPPQPEAFSFDCVEYAGLPACDVRPCQDLDGDPTTACGAKCTGEGDARTCVCGAISADGADPVASTACGYETPCNRLDCDDRQNQACYSGPPQTMGQGICHGGTHSCLKDGTTRSWGECQGEITPGKEICGNGLDDDCNGKVDDIDGITGKPCGTSGECGAEEICGNGLDDDCNGLADDGCNATGAQQGCYTGAAHTRNVGACHDGVQKNMGEFWGPCEGEVKPAAESCGDQVDSDCNGQGGPNEPDDPGCCTPSPEVCNGQDDDCDGVVDNGLLNACGLCDQACYDAQFPPADGGWGCPTCGLDGAGPGNPSDPASQCGADQLCLDRARYDQPYIWIARTNENRVQKINTTTFQTEFTVPPVFHDPPKDANKDDAPFGWSPSRTAVAIDGSVWIGHRGCHDSLSHCFAWDPNYGNAVHLASDGTMICRADVVSPNKDASCDPANPTACGSSALAVRAVTLDQYDNAWIGSWDEGAIYQFSGSQVDATQDPPRCTQLRKVDLTWNGKKVQAYGATVDSAGDLYIATLGTGPVLRIDTSSGQIVAGFQMPYPTYGLAVDSKHQVWYGVWSNKGGVLRLQTATGKIDHFMPPPTWNGKDLTCEQTSYTRGVAVDFDGNIWVANYSCSSTSEYGPDGNHIATYTVGRGPLGMAVATDGHVWAVNYDASTATVLDTADGTVIHTLTGLGGPYSYSDMTGLQLRLVTRQNGTWTNTYDSGYAFARWRQMDLTATIPALTHVCLQVRTAGTRAGLATAPYSTPVCAAEDVTPKGDLWSMPVYRGGDAVPQGQFDANQVPDGRFLQVQVELKGSNGVSPVVDKVEALWDRP